MNISAEKRKTFRFILSLFENVKTNSRKSSLSFYFAYICEYSNIFRFFKYRGHQILSSIIKIIKKWKGIIANCWIIENHLKMPVFKPTGLFNLMCFLLFNFSVNFKLPHPSFFLQRMIFVANLQINCIMYFYCIWMPTKHDYITQRNIIYMTWYT